MITYDELVRIARLAKLSVAAEDMDLLMADMGDIIQVAQSIDDADLSLFDCKGGDETADLRDDVVVQPLSADLILRNAPKKQDGCFVGSFGAGNPE